MKQFIFNTIVMQILICCITSVCYAGEYQISQLSSNLDGAIYPKINDNRQVVWESSDGVYFYNGKNIDRLSYGGSAPDINNNGQIVWETSEEQIYLFNGSEIKTLGSGWQAHINELGDIVWSDNFAIKLFRLDTGKIYTLTEQGNYHLINDLGYAIWREGGDTIKLYDRKNIKTIIGAANSITHIDINDKNQVVYDEGNGGVYLYDIQTKSKVNLSSTGTSPYINNNGKVIWVEREGNNSRLFIYDGNQTSFIADNAWLWRIAENDQVIWWERSGGLYTYSAGDITMLATKGGYFDVNSNGETVWTVKDDNSQKFSVYVAIPVEHMHETDGDGNSGSDDDSSCFISFIRP